MQTINGKLIAEPPELDQLKQNTEILNQQLERLEVQMTVTSKKDQAEQLQKLTSVQQSLQKIELIYSSLLGTTIFTIIGLASWYIWLGFNYDTNSVKLTNQPEPIVSVKPAASR